MLRGSFVTGVPLSQSEQLLGIRVTPEFNRYLLRATGCQVLLWVTVERTGRPLPEGLAFSWGWGASPSALCTMSRQPCPGKCRGSGCPAPQCGWSLWCEPSC